VLDMIWGRIIVEKHERVVKRGVKVVDPSLL
jgi:hypothetical protein